MKSALKNFGFCRKSGILMPISALPSPYGIGSFGKSAYDLIEFAMSSPANLTVVPMQDYLELTNDKGRMNTPAVAEGNWTWRMSPRYNTSTLVRKIQSMTSRTKRATK